MTDTKKNIVHHIHSYSLDTQNIQAVTMLMMIFVASYFLKDSLHYWIKYTFPKHNRYVTGLAAIILIVATILMAHMWGRKTAGEER